MSFKLKDLRVIYNQCSQDTSFNEVMLLHAIEGGRSTLRELKDNSLKNRVYIIKTLSSLKERRIIKEGPGSKPREYALTALGLKSLILLRVVTDSLMAKEDITTGELVEKIKGFTLEERNLKCLKVSYE